MTVVVTRPDGRVDEYMRFGDEKRWKSVRFRSLFG